MIENGWMLLVIGFAGAAMFFTFIWILTAPMRKTFLQREAEKEAVRQAEVNRAPGES